MKIEDEIGSDEKIITTDRGDTKNPGNDPDFLMNSAKI